MWWFNKICAIGIRKPLEVSDLYALNPEDTSEVLVPKWTRIWDQAMTTYNQEKQASERESRAQSQTDADTAPLLSANVATVSFLQILLNPRQFLGQFCLWKLAIR
jgi:hypothetical protein